MEPYAAGWLSILPPIIAIVLALITKEVFSSLLIGIFSGAAIYTFGSGVPDPLIKMLDVTFSLMGQKVDFQILLFFRLHVFDAQLFHHILTADLRDHMVVEDLHAGKTL